jgi:hypothetical protein
MNKIAKVTRTASLAIASSIVVGTVFGINNQAAAQDEYYYLRAKHSGQCLNVADSGQNNGDNVVQGSECNTSNFEWAIIPASRGYYYLQARHSGQCLNVADSGQNNGDNVVQGSECNTSNFEWAIIPTRGNLNYLKAKHSGQCLNVADSGQNNGDNVVQGSECNTSNFEWAIIPVESSRSNTFRDNYPHPNREYDQHHNRQRRSRIIHNLPRR